MNIITRLEEIVLISIWKLKDSAYGVTINREVSNKAGKKYSMGALYFTLDQLLKKGFVSKTVGGATTERGGRSKIYYQIAPDGEKALQAARKLEESLWEDVPEFVFGKD